MKMKRDYADIYVVDFGDYDDWDHLILLTPEKPFVAKGDVMGYNWPDLPRNWHFVAWRFT